MTDNDLLSSPVFSATMVSAARALRDECGLTLEQAAERVGVSDDVFREIERGQGPASVALLASIIRVMEESWESRVGDQVSGASADDLGARVARSAEQDDEYSDEYSAEQDDEWDDADDLSEPELVAIVESLRDNPDMLGLVSALLSVDED